MVTGAGRGIGRATALELARLGAAVVVNDLGTSTRGEGSDASLAESVASEIREAGGRAAANADSVSDFESAGRIVDTSLREFGSIDILVNNAGLSGTGAVWEVDPEDFRRIVESHLFGAFHCARHAAPHMKEQGWGRIVNLLSRSGITGIAGTTSYGAGKGGIFGLTNVWARDLAPYGVTVNGVNPSSTETRMVTDAVDAWRAEGGEMGKRAEALLAVLQKPEQVAVLIAALCSDSAAEITGECFLVTRNEVGLFRPLGIDQRVDRETPWQAAELAEALQGFDYHVLDAPY